MSIDSAHALRVELATALRERDSEREFRGAAEAAFAEQLARTEAAESALAAANARADEWQALAKTNAASLAVITESLTVARRECDGLRTALVEAKEALEHIWAAIGDRLCGEGPLAKEYAHGVTRQVDAARARIGAALGVSP